MIVDMIVSVLTGLVAAIPLVIKLVEYVHKAVRERNWTQLLALVMDFMQEAEKKFGSGIDRRDWVVSKVEAEAARGQYPVERTTVERLVDDLCRLSKNVNPPQTGGKAA